LFLPLSDFISASRYCFENARFWFVNQRDRLLDPHASAFFDRLHAGGYKPNAHIDVLVQHRLIYIAVPKCATTTVKTVLSALNGTDAVSREHPHRRRHSGLKSPRLTGLSTFYRLATSPATLRFSFVRNPYARLVSAWADKFSDKPLVPGDSFVDQYLALRSSIDADLPHGPDATLSFPQFVEFAVATSLSRVDAHWQLQDDLLTMPGIRVDFVGKVESFRRDLTRVLDHVSADRRLHDTLATRMNATWHRPWPDYYSPALAARVYRAYEADFSRFAYSRALTTMAAE
jgi:hypothetical protein